MGDRPQAGVTTARRRMVRRVRWGLAVVVTAPLVPLAAALMISVPLTLGADAPPSLAVGASGVLGVAVICGLCLAPARRPDGGVARSRQDQMILAVEHEIGSPLSHALAILGEGLRGDVPSGQVISDAMDCVVDLSQLMEDVLATARIMAGVIDPPREEMRLDEIVRGLPGVGASVRSELQFETSPMVAWGSPHLMRRAVSNLVRNAAAHGYSGPGAAIVIRVDEGGVTVQDDGPGIPPARLRLRGQKGLGLPLARWVAKVHGGRLVLRNRAEGGFEAQLQIHAALASPSSSRSEGE